MRDEIITVKYLDAMIISFSNEYLTIGTNTDIPDAQNMGDLFIYLYLVFGDHYNNPYIQYNMLLKYPHYKNHINKES